MYCIPVDTFVLNCLQFANRAKRITNRPVVNEVMDDKTMIKSLTREKNKLKSELDSVRVVKLQGSHILWRNRKLQWVFLTENSGNLKKIT